MSEVPRWALVAYRLALRAWPRAERDRWENEMISAYARLYALSRRRRGSSLVLVLHGIADVVGSGLRARARVHRSHRSERGADRKRASVMVTIWTDVRYAVRTLVRQPMFTLAAVLTLMLGIGANTAIFSIVYGLVLRPLPYSDPDRLVAMWTANPERGWTRMDVSPADAHDWAARSPSIAEVAVLDRGSANLTGIEQPQRLEARHTTTNVFRVFGVRFALGRDFTEADGEVGAPLTAILSHGFWQRQYGGRTDIVGETILLDGEPVTVIGVLPSTYLFPEDDEPAVYMPMQQPLTSFSRTNHAFVAFGRLAEGATVEVASREVTQVAASLAEEYPETNEGWTAYAVSLQSDLVGETGRQATGVLMSTVLLVLLMACVNVANLLLARANGRRRELVVRSALGAGRLRVVRQLLTESLVLSLVGGVFGVLLAVWGTHVIVALLPADMPAVFRIVIDAPVLLFALLVSVFSTLLFGLVPALRGTREAGLELRTHGRSEGRTARRFGGSLVVVQTALAVVLLVGGVIMMRSVSSMQSQELGWRADGVLTLRMTPPTAKYEDGEALNQLYDAVLERIRSIPGVRAAGTIQSLPLRGSNNVNTFVIEGENSDQQGYAARMGYLSTGYLETMRARVTRGRGFIDADRADGLRVALVNETLVRQRFGGEDPIGHVLRLNEASWTIVGVVANMIERAVTRAPEPSIYLPVTQSPVRTRNIAILTQGDPLALVDAVQRAIWSIDPDQPVYQVQSMQSLMDSRVSAFRLVAGLMLTFALVSLLLGAVGIYGVTAYGVGRRTGEIGVRLAVGADRRDVVRMILQEGVVRAALGLSIGLLAGFGLTRLLAGLLVGVTPNDPVTFASVIALLAAVTLLAAWLPARRAARLDPVRALSSQ